VEFQKKNMTRGRASAAELQRTICFLILVIHGNHEDAQKITPAGNVQ
jgi:hypothetical protein